LIQQFSILIAPHPDATSPSSFGLILLRSSLRWAEGRQVLWFCRTLASNDAFDMRPVSVSLGSSCIRNQVQRIAALIWFDPRCNPGEIPDRRLFVVAARENEASEASTIVRKGTSGEQCSLRLLYVQLLISMLSIIFGPTHSGNCCFEFHTEQPSPGPSSSLASLTNKLRRRLPKHAFDDRLPLISPRHN